MTRPSDTLTPLILISEIKPRINAKWPNGDVSSRVSDMIVELSQGLSGLCNRRFDEYIETRRYTPTSINDGGDLYGLRSLRLDQDLKSYTTIINGDASTIVPGNVTLIPMNDPYKQAIRLNPYGIQFWYHAGVTDPIGSISVSGTWGWGGNWIDPGAGALAGNISSSQTTITVTDGTKLEAGMIIKLTTAAPVVEYMKVTAVPTTAGGAVTVIRGFNSDQPAVAHVTGETVTRWQASQIVRQVVSRWLMIWLEQDASPLFGQQIISDTPFPITVDSMPKDLVQIILTNGLKRRPRVQGV